jgi:hypothetical protein
MSKKLRSIVAIFLILGILSSSVAFAGFRARGSKVVTPISGSQ